MATSFTLGKRFQLDIVSLEQSIFSDKVEGLIVTGKSGELGILSGHAPLLTLLKPGEIRIFKEGKEEPFYISGGILEVQPHIVTILADTIIRAKDLDEASALETKARLEQSLREQKTEINYALAAGELASTLAQLRVIERIKKNHSG